MKILVINCSPKKETSLTYKSSLFLKKYYGKEDEFKYIFAADGRFPEKTMKISEMPIWLFSVLHCIISAFMLR